MPYGGVCIPGRERFRGNCRGTYECYSSGRFRGSGVTAEGHMNVTVQVGLEVQG